MTKTPPPMPNIPDTAPVKVPTSRKPTRKDGAMAPGLLQSHRLAADEDGDVRIRRLPLDDRVDAADPLGGIAVFAEPRRGARRVEVKAVRVPGRRHRLDPADRLRHVRDHLLAPRHDDDLLWAEGHGVGAGEEQVAGELPEPGGRLPLGGAPRMVEELLPAPRQGVVDPHLGHRARSAEPDGLRRVARHEHPLPDVLLMREVLGVEPVPAERLDALLPAHLELPEADLDPTHRLPLKELRPLPAQAGADTAFRMFFFMAAIVFA